MNRDILTLLKITLSAVHTVGIHTGLCGLIHYSLLWERVINAEEYFQLYEYLSKNRPKEPLTESMFWWPMGQDKPRIEFLENLIKQLEDEETSH